MSNTDIQSDDIPNAKEEPLKAAYLKLHQLRSEMNGDLYDEHDEVSQWAMDVEWIYTAVAEHDDVDAEAIMEDLHGGDGPPPADFDYGETLSDGQYENHPTTDTGEFVQPVRKSYVHDACGSTTTMNDDLAESFARAPEQYGKTFCANCGDYYPLSEFVWKGTDTRLDTVGEVDGHE